MITLFTGMPGAGKTAAMLDVMRELARDRPLFVHFDPAERLRPEQKLLHETLQLPHQPVNAATWHDQVPDGGILVIDEAQGCWRPRGPASKVPPAIAALETHRHAGIDIFLTTQAPRLIDANVRGLIGRHVHIRDTGWLGRWWYEWPETNESLTWKTCPVKKKYKLPAAVFKLYTSANEHFKPVRSAPKTLLFVIALLVALAVLVFMMVRTFRNHTAAPAAAPVPAVVKPGPVVVPVAPASSPVAESSVDVQAVDERIAFFPRLSDRPWTAPAYDHLRTVVHMPVIAGGVCMDGRCVCVTGDGARLDVSSNACAEWIKARPFNPYVLPPVPQAPAPTVVAARDDTGEGRKPSSRDRNVPAREESVTVVPMPEGVSNPRADARQASPLPPGSPVHPTPIVDDWRPIAPPSLLSPYRVHKSG